MNNTIVLTSIYQEFWGTKEFRKSCKRVNLPIHNAWKGAYFTGHANTLRYDYEALIELKDKYEYAIYSDGADTLFLKAFQPPSGCIIYSTEKAIWPPTDQMKYLWNKYYTKIGFNNTLQGFTEPYTGSYSISPWKYLNGGGWCGPIPLLIEFFENYGLNNIQGEINGQDVQTIAFMKAYENGFPIFLDTQCKYFQTIAFADPTDFYADETIFKNMITGNEPCVLHGNGRTNMTNLYKLLNK